MAWRKKAYRCEEMKDSTICPPDPLINMLQDPDIKISNPHEFLLCILNVLATELNFLPSSSFNDWKRKHFYSVPYVHPTTGDIRCYIKYIPQGSSAFVFASVENNDVSKMSLVPQNFIVNSTESDAAKIYKNVPYLSKLFKDIVLWKMLASLQECAGVSPTFGLSTLAHEIKLEILCNLDVLDLVSLAAVNQEFHNLIEHPSIWQYMLLRDFPHCHYKTDCDWKQLYKIEFVSKQEAQKLKEEERKRFHEQTRNYHTRAPRGILPDEYNVGLFDLGNNYLHPRPMYTPNTRHHLLSRNPDMAYNNLHRF